MSVEVILKINKNVNLGYFNEVNRFSIWIIRQILLNLILFPNHS